MISQIIFHEILSPSNDISQCIIVYPWVLKCLNPSALNLPDLQLRHPGDDEEGVGPDQQV